MSNAKLPGWTMSIWLPEAPEDEAQAFMDTVAALAMAYEPRTRWDAHVSAELVYEEADKVWKRS